MEKRHPNHPGELSANPLQAERLRDHEEINARARAIDILFEAGVPFVVGGAYAYAQYTGIYRDTKDLDLFPRKGDAGRALEALAQDGWRTERTDEVWLYKAFKGEWFVDLIFSSSNGVASVDDLWFSRASRGIVFGRECLLAPPEELIWSKAFVCERERYDGSDVTHLIKCAGPRMDWSHLLRRFDRYWEVLFAHVLMFRFAYPSERTSVPDWVMAELLSKANQSLYEGNWPDPICRGPLISRVNYGVDIGDWGYRDGRAWDEAERQREERDGGRAGTEASRGGSG